MIYDAHIVNILMQFYLDKDFMKVYHGRWDTWLVTKNYMDEYLYLMMKTDSQLANILKQAQTKANEIKDTPLAKALREDE